MRSRIQTWIRSLTKSGLMSMHRKNQAKSGYSRPLRVESLEDRRMLAAGNFTRLAATLPGTSNAIEVEAIYDGAVIDARAFPPGEQEVFLGPTTVFDNEANDNGVAEISFSDSATLTGLGTTMSTVDSLPRKAMYAEISTGAGGENPSIVNRIGNHRASDHSNDLTGIETEIEGTSGFMSGGYSRVAFRTDSVARFQYDDHDSQSSDLFNGTLELVTENYFDLFYNGEIGNQAIWEYETAFKIEVHRVDVNGNILDTFVDIVFTVDNRADYDILADPIVVTAQNTLTGSIVGYDDVEEIPITNGILHRQISFSFSLEDGDIIEYRSSIGEPPTLASQYGFQSSRSNSVADSSGYSIAEANIFGMAVEEGDMCDADFDDDGDVDGRDFLIWQRGYGTPLAENADGDADGDGDVDTEDLQCWREHYGFASPAVTGDFDQDDDIDADDYTVLLGNFGMTSNATLADGDADNDGDVDEADFISWQVDYAEEIGNDDWIDNALNFDPDDLANGQIIVTNQTDDNDGNYSLGDLSLREALALAALADGSNTIVFANYATAPGTLTLTGGQLEVTSDVTIAGPGADEFAISGNNLSRVFNITSSTAVLDVTISGLIITGGKTSSNGHGGGIYNTENLTLDHVVVQGNWATANGEGGGLYSLLGNVTIESSTFDDNDARHGGGALIFVGENQDAIIDNSTFSNNTAVATGGGLRVEGHSTTSITTDTFHVSNSTFSNNHAGTFTGALRALNNVNGTIIHSTFTDNDAPTEGGLSAQGGSTNVLVHNSILVGNTDTNGDSRDDATGGIHVDSSYNLYGVTNSASLLDANGHDDNNIQSSLSAAKLAPLGNYGGATQTHALLIGSTAIDAAASNFGLAVDQLGRTRGSSQVDIGSFESGNDYELLVTTSSDESNSGYGANDLSLREALELTDSLVGRATISFADNVTEIIVGPQLVIDKDMTIAGPGADVLTLDGNDQDRVLFVEDTVFDGVISGLTITRGQAWYDDTPSGLGGGIYNEGILTLDTVTLDDNFAYVNGGGIYTTIGNSGSGITVRNSTISNNTAGQGGGGIYIDGAGSHAVQILNSTISTNSANYSGSGITDNSGLAAIVNSTITLNTSSSTSAGISGSGGTSLSNTIVAANTNGLGQSDLSGSFSSNSRHNLIGYDPNLTNGINDNGGSGNMNQVGESAAIDAKLSALADWGGPTMTHKLLEDSLAINAGDEEVLDDFELEFDQRGFDRVVDGAVDIGAVEAVFSDF